MIPPAHWRVIPGFAGRYWIHVSGQIQGADGKRRCQQRSANGYWRVHLSRSGRQGTYYVHRLVAAAFLGPCPPGMVVCHGPAGQGCNALSNLRYASHRENCGADKLRDGTHQRGERHGRSQLKTAQVLAIRALASQGYSKSDIAWALGVSRVNVAHIITRRRWAWLEADGLAGGPEVFQPGSGPEHGSTGAASSSLDVPIGLRFPSH